MKSSRTPHNSSWADDVAAISRERVYPLLFANRRLVALATYALITCAAYFLAFLLRYEFEWPNKPLAPLAASLAVLLVIRTSLAVFFKLSTGRWRFVSTADVVRLLLATTVGSLLFYVVARQPYFVSVVPRSVILLEWLISSYLTAGLWLTYRIGFERLRLLRAAVDGQKRALIVGAGEAGSMLVHEMRRSPTGYQPVALLDDDRAKQGMLLHGVEVVGTTEDLPAIVRAEAIEEVILAIPSASPERLRHLLELCEETEVAFKILPHFEAMLNGGSQLSQLREVRIEDLLGREPIRLELPELAQDLAGETVLITGAAGSIGSELTRQIALNGPDRLVMLDQNESELFYLDLEVRAAHPRLDLVPIVGDITNESTVERVFAELRPTRIFHAAAYKHVPLMERNPIEAVRTNVIGTWKVADAAGRYACPRFVLVSTDKAVRPANVMGATKRLAELIVLEAQRRYPETSYGAVRFGNVLGSTGSVVPIFRRQLEAGAPLTVTHPEVTRYFMTIPEAVQLILQSSLLPDLRGHILMLEMGAPVKVLDLARNMLRLSGSKSQEIVFTGLRPGEKLHEELVGPDECTMPTEVEKVHVVAAGETGMAIIHRVAAWETHLRENGESSVVRELLALFPDLQLDIAAEDDRPRRRQSESVVGLS